MKIVLATCGSRGDVQPMITLCLSLQNAGHDALLIGPPEKAQWAEQLGCRYMPFGRDVTAFIDTKEDVVKLSTALSFVGFVREEIRTQFEILPSVIENADLAIGASLMFGLSSIAEYMDIPYRYIAFTPQLFESASHPFLAIKTQIFPSWMNRLTWKAYKILDRLNTTHLLNQYREKMGLNAIPDAWDHILGGNPIAACDKAVAGIPGDVNIHVTQTGFLHPKLTRPKRPDLDDFLSKGAKPVYAGFGSMPPKDQQGTLPMLIAAARKTGVRMVIAKFWDEPYDGDIDDSIFFINAYPHLDLFPKMAAAIHHGGAGTTAAAALAGIPQIIVPHILDQYYHGRKIYTAGLGPRPIHRSRLSDKKLAEALNECLSNPDIKQTARSVSMQINPHESIKAIVKTIESNA